MFSKNKKSLQFFSIVELISVTLFTHIPFLHYECKRLQTQPAGLNTKKTPAQAHLGFQM